MSARRAGGGRSFPDAGGPGVESGRAATRSDRAVRWLARAVTGLLYRSVEVGGEPDRPIDRDAVLATANHFGGFADPLLLTAVAERRPRFLARDVIWKVPVVRAFMTWMRAIPVHTRKDGAGSNRRMFESSEDALAERDLVVVFPEGATSDDPSILPVRTGAARILLGALARGVAGIRVVAVGIHYADKAALRSRVYVRIGPPVVLDGWAEAHLPSGSAHPEDHQSVRLLTAEIEQRLRSVSPNFSDWREARALSLAAEVTLVSETGDVVSYAQREELAGLIARSATSEQREAIVDAVALYRTTIEALALPERWVALGEGDPVKVKAFLVAELAGLPVLAPVAAVGGVLNALPLGAVLLAGRVKTSPAMMATVKPLVAVGAFGLTWSGLALLAGRRWGVGAGVATFAAMPALLAASIRGAEQAVLLVRLGRVVKRVDGLRGDPLAAVQVERQTIVDAVRAVTEGVPVRTGE